MLYFFSLKVSLILICTLLYLAPDCEVDEIEDIVEGDCLLVKGQVWYRSENILIVHQN